MKHHRTTRKGFLTLIGSSLLGLVLAQILSRSAYISDKAYGGGSYGG